MEKTLKLAVLMMASVLSLTFSSCEKEPEKPTDTEQPTAVLTAQDLAGTSWRCTMENTYYQQGIAMNISFESMLDFLDTENGEYFEMAVLEVPLYPAANRHVDQTYEFTYAIDGNKILITMIYEDETSDTSEFIYNPETETISFDTQSPEMERMMGSRVYVFTKVQ